MAVANKRPDVAQLELYRFEYDLIPLHHYTFKDSFGRERGKSPRDKDWRNKVYRFDEVIAHAKSGLNVGVRLRADQLVIDVDPRRFKPGVKLGVDSPFEDFCKVVGLDPSTCPTVETGSGGRHYYLRKPSGVLLVDSLKDFDGVEFKSLGRQVVAAGSVHPSGVPYTWNDFCPDPGSEPPAPEMLLRLAARPDRVRDANEEGGELTPELLARNLELLDPTDYKDHDSWLAVMQACHHATAGEGRQEFIDWSTSDPDYADHAFVIGRRWDSLHSDRGGAATVTYRTLYRELKKHGHEPVHEDAENDFEEDEVWKDAQEQAQHDGQIARAKAGAPTSPPSSLSRGQVKTLQQLNQVYWVVDGDGAPVIMHERIRPDPRTSRPRRVYGYHTFTGFKQLLQNRRILTSNKKGEDVLEYLGDTWLEWPERRTYYDVVCDPDPNRRDDPDVFNMFRGWGVSPAKGDWSLMKSHMLDVLCSGVQAHYDYLLKWCAFLFQRPHELPKVAVVLTGGKGAGKGMFGDSLLALAGQHGQYASNSEHVVGRFNGHLRDCIFLFADEAFYAGDKASESDLKSLITQSQRLVEAKHKTPEQATNLLHVLMASNRDWVVPASSDERRYAIFRVSDHRAPDKSYFAALAHQMYEQSGLEAMLYDLLTLDIAGWHPVHDIPQTEALSQNKLLSMSAFEAWWYSVLERGLFPGDLLRGDWSSEELLLPNQLLIERYSEFKREKQMRGPSPVPTVVPAELAKLVDGLGKTRRRPPDGYTEMLDVNAAGLVACQVVPDLRACREAFDRRFGTNLVKEN